MLNPFIEIISAVIGIINFALIVWIILGLLIQFDIVNPNQPLILRARFFLDRVFNPLLRPIRRYIPLIGGMDLSPLVLLLGLRFIDSAMYHWFWGI